MGDVIEIKSKQPIIEEEIAETWTVVDALNECIKEIEAKTISPTHVYVAMVIPGKDDMQRLAYVQAGMSNLWETIAILKVHADFHTHQWCDDDT